MLRLKKHMFEASKSSSYDPPIPVNERYSLQMHMSDIIVQNLVVEIVRDIRSMNDVIHIGMEEQGDGRNEGVRSKRRKRVKWNCFR